MQRKVALEVWSLSLLMTAACLGTSGDRRAASEVTPSHRSTEAVSTALEDSRPRPLTPSLTTYGRVAGRRPVTATSVPGAGGRSTSSVPGDSAAISEWTIGVDLHDGRELYQAWVRWLNTQDRSEANVASLCELARRVPPDTRSEIAAAATTAGDPSGLRAALCESELPVQEARAVARIVAGGDGTRRLELVAALGDSDPGVYLLALAKLASDDPTQFRASVSEGLLACSAGEVCAFTQALHALAPGLLEQLVRSVGEAADTCGLPHSVDDLRRIAAAQESGKSWCAD